MGGGTYSFESRSAYENTVKHKSINEIFSTKMKSEMSPMNLGIRESRDSDEHPESVPIIIALDVTGSMGRIPEAIVKNDLTHIMNGIIQSGILHPQVMFLGIGDHISDRSPLQVGQFESSDQLLAKWLEAIYLERGGGGDVKESYMLAWLVGGKHTSIDSLEKRNKKGFLFTIGDEANHSKLTAEQLMEITGESSQGYTDKELLALAQEKYYVYHFHTNDGSYPNDKRILDYWRDLLGQNLIVVSKYTEIAHKIAEIVSSTYTGTTDKTKGEEVEGKKEEESPIL